MTVAVCRVCLSQHVSFNSGNVGIHHARATGQPSGKAPSRAVVQFIVPDVFRTRQHGLEYSRYGIEAATSFADRQYAEGIIAISRWLSAATPPDAVRNRPASHG